MNSARGFIIGSKLTELRESKGWTQDELSKRTGISRVLISRYENNTRPNKKNFKQILKVFKLEPDYFYKLSVSESKPNEYSDDPHLNEMIKDFLLLPKEEQTVVVSLVNSIKSKYLKKKVVATSKPRKGNLNSKKSKLKVA